MAPDDAAAERWLLDHRHGTDAATALRFFDGRPPVRLQDVLGRWHGSGWHTGHPWDGVLEALGWYGKEMVEPEHVLPTLVRDRDGRPVPVDPGPVPVGLIRRRPGLVRRGPVPVLFRAAAPLLRSARPAGRLRMVEVRGVVSAGLVYDGVPILDAFRRVTPDLLLGAGDIRGEAAPLMFVLRRSRNAASSRPSTSPAPGIPLAGAEE